MSRKKLLVSLLTVTAVTGFLLVAKAFLSSLNPSASAGALLPHIDISDPEPGEYRYEQSGVTGCLDIHWLIIRDYNGGIHVYTVPRRYGKFYMPDISWFRPGGLCDDFGPETENGRIKPGGVIRCHDEDIGDWGSREWRWRPDGGNPGNYTADMERTRHVIEGKFLVIGKY